MLERGIERLNFLRALICLCVLLVVTTVLLPDYAKAANSGTNLTALNTILTVSPTPTSLNAPVVTSFSVRTMGSSMNTGTMTVSLYCDTPMYLTFVGPGAPVFQYPGLQVDLRSGYSVKKENIPVTQTLNLTNACTYSGKGITYQPIVVVEHAGYAAWSSTNLKTNAAVTPSPTASKTASPLTNYKLNLTGSASTATAPFTDTLTATVMIPSTTVAGAWVPFYGYGGGTDTHYQFHYNLCCAKDSLGYCTGTNTSFPYHGSPYTFSQGCTYTRAGTYTREARVDNQMNLNTTNGYKYATNQITIKDPVTTLNPTFSSNPTKPNNSQTATLTAYAGSNNVINTVNYSFWWHCNTTTNIYADAVRACGDPTNATIGAKFDGVSAVSIYKSTTHKYSQAGIYKPKVIIEQGGATATKSFDLTVSNAPTLVPLIQAVNKNSIVSGKRQYDLIASQSGWQTETDQNFNIWWNCNQGLDSFTGTLLLCGSTDPTYYRRFVNQTANSVTVTHGYAPGTYKPKVIVQRDGLEKAAYVDLVVPAIVASPSPVPSSSPSRTPSPVPSPSRTPSPLPSHSVSPSRTPSPVPSPSPSRTPSPSPSPSVVPSPSPSPQVNGVLSVSLAITPTIRAEGQTISITANVGDTNTANASTTYTYWWHCDNPSTSVQEVMNDPDCGLPRISGDPATDTAERRANGFQLTGAYATGGGLLNTHTGTKTFPAGPRTIKVIIERRNQAIETRQAISVNPLNLDVDLNIEPAVAQIGQTINLSAITESNDTSSNYSYYFWWNCENTTSSVAEASQASVCGPPTDASKGDQFLNQSNLTTTKSTSTNYSSPGTKKPKIIVVHGNLSTSYVGQLVVTKPSFSATLTSNPAVADGEANGVHLTATAVGADPAKATVNYTYWWNCDRPGVDIAALSQASACGNPIDSTYGAKVDDVRVNTMDLTHDYTMPGTYHPKVIVEWDGADPAEADTQLVVNDIPDKTLNVALSATRVGQGFPVQMSLGANLTGTATGPSTVKIWWDCQPDFSNISILSNSNQCGDPADPTKGMIAELPANQSIKSFLYTYSLPGTRHPVVVAERESVTNYAFGEIEIPSSQSASPTPTVSVGSSPSPTFSPSPTASPSVSPSPTQSPATSINIPAGFSVLGFNFDFQSSLFGEKGIKVYSLNQAQRQWNIIEPNQSENLKSNKAYYLLSNQATSIESPTGQINSETNLTPGWNFVWNESSRNLDSFRVTLQDNGQCVAKDVPLGVLRSDSVIYRWIYVVQNDTSIVPCQAFSLLTGTNKPSTGCSETNPLLNEVSSIDAKKGLWIYLFQNNLNNWAGKTNYSCN